MIDLIALRKYPEIIIELIKRKDPQFDIEKLIELDVLVRQLKTVIEDIRHKKNELARLGQKTITDELKEQSKLLSKDLKEKEAQLEKIESEFNDLYLKCPNVIFDDVPKGGKENNVVIKQYGQKPKFDFEPKNHIELGELNNWFDFETASKMTGPHFVFYKGIGVHIIYILSLYMLKNNIKFGYFPVLPPYLVNEKSLINSSNLPRFEEDIYKIQDENLYLIPTSEVNLTNVYQDHIFLIEELPKRMTCWTSCFRKEAGGYGAAERGLIRLHQFEKLELYTICALEFSDQEQNKMIECAEAILKDLGLHYRIVLLAAQDSSFASAKTYDIEVWLPGQGIYKEISSISNCTDFQARRAGIRYRKSLGEKTHFVYTLNGSSLALSRLMVALIETYQKKDGTIELPDKLKSIELSLG